MDLQKTNQMCMQYMHFIRQASADMAKTKLDFVSDLCFWTLTDCLWHSKKIFDKKSFDKISDRTSK